MYSVEELLIDLEKYRTPNEMKEYMDEIRAHVHANPDLHQKALIKKGKFKKLLEEFNPLLLFGHSRFCPPDSKMKIVLGNQGYDAVIASSNRVFTKLEITSYLNGQADYLDGLRINERGYGEVRFGGSNTLDVHAANYLEKVLDNARKKSMKSYTDACLLIVVDTTEYFGAFELNDSDFVISLKNELSKIKFDAQDVYLMILNHQNIDAIDENIFKLQSEDSIN